MDRLERLAFNSLPAALWPDVTANVYHHCSNQVEAAGNEYSYALYFCCTANCIGAGPTPRTLCCTVRNYQCHWRGPTRRLGVRTVRLTPWQWADTARADRYPFADSATIVVDKEQHDEGSQTAAC